MGSGVRKVGLKVGEEVVGGERGQTDWEEGAAMDRNCVSRRNKTNNQGEWVRIAPDLPNPGIWLINKISGLCIFYMALLEH